jgi:LemA protein
MTWIVLGGLLVVVVAGIAIYNGLVRLRNQVRTAWSDIDVQLLRRHDLVPRLVEAVKAYATHERTLLESVIALRAQALDTRSPARLAGLENQLEKSLTQLLALREAYPDLKASENFSQLQRDLVDVEEHLQYARRFYNGAVRDLNDGIQRFPSVLVARATGFREAEFFSAEDDARAAPVIGAPA